MSAQERLLDRGTRLARAALARVGADLRAARTDRGLSIDAVAATLGISNAQVSRIERALAPAVPVVVLIRFATLVGLDLTVRTYPGPDALRDAPQLGLVDDFRRLLHRSLRWATEVPLPVVGDQRAWDGLVSGGDWRYGVEFESLPRDSQALVRRINLKQRDGAVDGVLLVLRDTRNVRRFRAAAAAELASAFPVPGPAAARHLRDGLDPEGSSVILIPRRGTRAVGASASRLTPQV